MNRSLILLVGYFQIYLHALFHISKTITTAADILEQDFFDVCEHGNKL